MSRTYERGRVSPRREDLAAIAKSASVLIIALNLSRCPLASRPHRFLSASSATVLSPRVFVVAVYRPAATSREMMHTYTH